MRKACRCGRGETTIKCHNVVCGYFCLWVCVCLLVSGAQEYHATESTILRFADVIVCLPVRHVFVHPIQRDGGRKRGREWESVQGLCLCCCGCAGDGMRFLLAVEYRSFVHALTIRSISRSHKFTANISRAMRVGFCWNFNTKSASHETNNQI